MDYSYIGTDNISNLMNKFGQYKMTKSDSFTCIIHFKFKVHHGNVIVLFPFIVMWVYDNSIYHPGHYLRRSQIRRHMQA